MYGSFEEIIKKIVENTDLDEHKVRNMIKEKENEFSGLISPEGAAHIVAKELGLNLLERTAKELKIGNILSGMNNVSLTAKIVRIFEPREWEKDGKKGKVANLIIGDETGQARMSLWNEQVEPVESGKIKPGQVVEIVNGYTKDSGMGGCEVRLGKKGLLKESEASINVKSSDARSMKISDLVAGSFAEVRGTMVQFFDSNPFYFVCPKCDGKISEGKCEEHGKVEPKPVLVINGILDDGYGNVRAVFFREHAEKILGMKTDEAYKLAGNGKDTGPLKEKMDERLGKDFAVRGRVKVNKFFERIEFVASEVKEVDPEKEAKAILNKLEDKK